jgi:transmembrane sensor
MSGREAKYLNYAVEDFVWDDEFRNWVNAPDETSEEFWRNWLLEHPQKEAVINAAKQIVVTLVPRVADISLPEIEFEVEQILNRRDKVALPDQRPRVYHLKPSVLWKAAAMLILVAGFTALFFMRKLNDSKLNTIATSSGVQKTIRLSDSSTVILNSNSKLSFKKSWGRSEAREIWLDGEGYFEVQHLDKDKKISNHERFLVHVKGITVEVLGTTFNIRDRRGKTEIVLKEGSIRLSFDNHSKADITMTPEEIVTIGNDANSTVSISKVRPAEYSAWIHQKLILNNTYLSDIIQYLEDNYGKKVILSDSSLQSKRIEGTLMLDNLDDALFVLSKVLKVKIKEDDSSIYFIKM